MPPVSKRKVLKAGETTGNDGYALIEIGGEPAYRSISNGGAVVATIEDFNIPIDYQDITALDPTPGVIFLSQASVDAELGALGINSFKHIEAAYNALPDQVNHKITFEVAAGQQRALGNVPTIAYNLNTKNIVDGSITIIGASPSQWELVDVSLDDLVITALQVGGGNPWIQFADTPFSGFDLKGSYAILSTGQVVVIHDHTDDTLYVMTELSPNPVGETVSVRNPSTTFVNLLDDGITIPGTAYHSTVDSRFYIKSNITGVIFFENVGIDFTGSTGNGIYIAGNIRFTNVKMYGVGSTVNQILNSLPIGYVGFVNFVSSTSGGTAWSPFMLRGSGRASTNCYLRGVYLRGPTIQQAAISNLYATLFGVVFDDLGNANDPGTFSIDDAYADIYQGIGGNKYNEIRNVSGPASGLVLSNGATLRTAYQRLIFKNCSKPCVLVYQTTLDISLILGSLGLLDGGGNTDVGIELRGPAAVVKLNAGTNVTGTLGDVRLSDGEIVSYATIVADGPLIDPAMNTIDKA